MQEEETGNEVENAKRENRKTESKVAIARAPQRVQKGEQSQENPNKIATGITEQGRPPDG